MILSTAANPLDELEKGALIGASSWLTITQEMINSFGASTLDPDPMHVDPEWAKAHGPFDGTIAFGFLTMSLLTHLMDQAMDGAIHRQSAKVGYYLNYGFNRLRLVSPVYEGKRVRGVFHFKDRAPDEKGRIIQTVAATIEIEGEDRPALVADWLSVWVPPEVA
jgi:acyl dehydratase